LTPYFVAYIADGVKSHSKDLVVLGRLLGLAKALLNNPEVHLEPYVKQLMPAVMSTLLMHPLGEGTVEGSW
jgi:transcription initiation factor TFIID subunit 6